MKTFYRVAALIAFLLAALGVGIAAGCYHVDPTLASQVKLLHTDAKLKTAAAADKAKIADAAARANPDAHPIRYITVFVKETRAKLVWVFMVSLMLGGASVGLALTPLSIISKFATPVFGGVAITSLAGIITLPFFPWILLAAIVAALGIFIYEIIRYKSLPAAIGALEAEFESILPSAKPLISQIPGAAAMAQGPVESLLAEAATAI